MGEGRKAQERGDIYIMICTVTWQKSTQRCKGIILQSKKKKKKTEEEEGIDHLIEIGGCGV